MDPVPIAAGKFPGKIPACPELRGHVLFETSGSSGTPKWVALSKEALLVSAVAVNRHLKVTAASIWGLALPPQHVGGFGVAARAFGVACGFSEFGRRWDAPEFGKWLAENQVTHTSLVPTQVHDLVAAGLCAPASLRAMVVGGGHLDAATGQAARALGWPVLASYGMTEAASQIATQGLELLETLYQPSPIPLLPIWQAETTPEQKLRISGPALFSGMLARENAAWIFNVRPAQWYQTQDRVQLENRCLTPLGRADTLVKVLGELVDPEAIERELVDLSTGQLAPGTFAVVAVPDSRAEHALVPVFEAAVDAALIAAVLTAYAEQASGLRQLRPPVLLAKFPRRGIRLGARLRPTSTQGRKV
jgi:O-succinylbenzoic acid--CoA ligase